MTDLEYQTFRAEVDQYRSGIFKPTKEMPDFSINLKIEIMEALREYHLIRRSLKFYDLAAKFDNGNFLEIDMLPKCIVLLSKETFRQLNYDTVGLANIIINLAHSLAKDI